MALVLATASIAGCGGSAVTRVPDASLILDFTPNAVHAGIYSAIARGFDRRNHIRLRVLVPSASTDSIKLLAAGRVDFAVLDIHDLAIARERGAAIKGIMAIVERPLAAVIAQPQISSPRQLIGKLVGVTGAPSDVGVLDSEVSGAGGNPALVNTITIGFNAVADLLARRVVAATAFWNDEGVTLERRRGGFHIFRVDDYGAPPYPELVLCASSLELRRDPGLARSVVRALVAGYRFTLGDPARSAADLERQVGGLDPSLVEAELSVLVPAFRDSDGQVGVLDAATLRRWAAWEANFGVVRARPDAATMFARGFVSPSAAG